MIDTIPIGQQGTTLDLSIEQFLHGAMLYGVANVFDAGAIWKRAGRRDHRPGLTLEEALRAMPRTPETEPDFVASYYGHIRVYLPYQSYVLDQTKGRGIAAAGMVARLTELHRQSFGGLLGKGGSTRIEVHPDVQLGRDQVRFEFGAAVFLHDPEASPRQLVRFAIGDEPPRVMARIYPGQDLAMLCDQAAASPDGHAHWPYGPGIALLVMAETGQTSKVALPEAIPAFHLGVQRIHDGEENGERQYRITHPEHPDAVLTVSAPRMTRRVPDSTAPFRAQPDELSDEELRDALNALAGRRGSQPKAPGNRSPEPERPARVPRSVRVDGEPSFGNLDALDIRIDAREPRFDDAVEPGSAADRAMPSADGAHTGVTISRVSPADRREAGGTVLSGGTFHAKGLPGLWIVGMPLHRLSIYAGSGVRSLTIPLRRLVADAPDQSLVVNADDEILINANGVLSPFDPDVSDSLPAGLQWRTLPPVAQASYLGWLALPRPVPLMLSSDGWQGLGRGEGMPLAPNWVADPALLSWDGATPTKVSPEQFNFSRHQLDLAPTAEGLKVRMRGQAPAYLLAADGRLRDVLRKDGVEEGQIIEGELLVTGNYVLAAPAAGSA